MVAAMADSDPSGVSRRGFLIRSGTGGAASLLGASAVPALRQTAQAAPGPVGGGVPPLAPPVEMGPGLIPVQLLVNGKTLSTRVEPRDTLAHVLRESLGLTGTKIGCDRGACGACTVWVDGVPTPACMTLALDVAGTAGKGGRIARPVTTIEGLSAGGALHPVQEAFVGHDALQCGFCTPGMVMSCAALYERKRTQGTLPALAEGEVRDAIAGNLCRCGTYPHVVDAMLAAAKRPTGSKGGGRR